MWKPRRPRAVLQATRIEPIPVAVLCKLTWCQMRGRVGDGSQEGRLEPSLEWAWTHVLDWPKEAKMGTGGPPVQ